MEILIVKNLCYQLFFNIINMEKIVDADDRDTINEFYELYQDFFYFLCDFFEIEKKNITKDKNVLSLKQKFDIYKDLPNKINKNKYLYKKFYLEKNDHSMEEMMYDYLFS